VEGYRACHDGAVFESPWPRGYPPPRNTWQFPPPLVPRRWKWAAVLAGLLGLTAGVAMTTLVVVVGNDDFPGVIDDASLTDTVASQCELMTRTVLSMPLDGTPERRADTIRDQNRAVTLMVRQIRAERAEEIRADRPAEEWLRDWDRLVDARAEWARELLSDPNASLELPVDGDGDDITERMDDVWAAESACEVPDAIASPGGESRSDA
jgi:hypothetical protein